MAISTPAHGFGIRTHLWIADQVYADLADCKLNIRDQLFDVAKETCDAIRANRGAFLSGSIGPDAFPDLVVGQSVVHPGVEGGWQAEDWLQRLLENARAEDEIAFSWGYAMHFAGDMFAHTYVNNYAGDVFELFAGGTPNVELRHFRLEKYVEQHLDYTVDPRDLEVPAGFLARQLVEFDYTAVGPIPSRLSAGHMRTMFAALQLAREARARAPALEKDAIKREADALARLHTVEHGLGLEPSNGVPFDRRGSAFRALSSSGRAALERAHLEYQEAADRSRRDRALVVFVNAWVADIEGAAQNYIRASRDFSVNMLRGSGAKRLPYREQRPMMEPYSRWFSCYSMVLRGQPLAVGDATCARLREMGADIDFADAALRSTMGSRARSVYIDLLTLERRLRDLIGRTALRVVSISDRNVAELLSELADPAVVDRQALNEAFIDSANGQLSFQCVADFIDADLGLRQRPVADAPCDGSPRTGGTMDPALFLPLHYALTLAKLSLLDAKGIGEVAERFGGRATEFRLSPHRRYSLLLDTVRSLDGNHQWQHEALPFPRRQPLGPNARGRKAGYPDPSDPDGGTGFPFYQSKALRETVFTRLFPKPFEGAILYRPEMRPPQYAFWPCEGDPLRGPRPKEAKTISGCRD